MSDAPATVADLMTGDVITLHIDDNLEEAEIVFSSAAIRHLPVVDDDKRLAGLVTHRDLLGAALSSILKLPPEDEAAYKRRILAHAVMTADVITVGPATTLRDAASLVLDHKLGCLPVVDDERHVVGILTESDFVRLALKFLT